MRQPDDKKKPRADDRPRRFVGQTLEDIRINTAPKYLVKGVLPRDGLGVIWGRHKSGKSFWAFDLIMHVVIGREYRGHKVRQGGVVYVALEGSSGFPDCIEAWRQNYLLDGDGTGFPFLLINNQRLDLIADYQDLILDIRRQLADPVIIVIDTLNRSLSGDENSSQDMSKYIRAADALGTAFKCLVLLVHHCGVAGNRPRGHSSLSGADDVSIAVERDKKDSDIIRATVEHMKDGRAGTVLAFSLQEVEVGTDDDSDPITSCIVVASDAAGGDAEPKLTKMGQLAYDALKRTLKDEGVEVKPDSKMATSRVPVGQRACLAESWRQQFYDLHPSDKPATKRQALFRATLELEDAGLLALVPDYVWMPGKA
jgi:AAA domain